jgi:putative oxidoreductase
MSTLSTPVMRDPVEHRSLPVPETPEQRAVAILRRVSALFLRASLGVLFVWFGALKLAGATPVAALVAGTVDWIPFVDPAWFVPALGAFEVAIGAALLIGWHTPLILGVLAAHLAGTFLVLVVQPEVAFQQGNPLLLTVEGEFVVKNLALIAGALLLAASTPTLRPTPAQRRVRGRR